MADLGEEYGHRVLKVRGKGGKVILAPLPPAAARAIARAVDERDDGPILRNARGARMDRHAATRRLRHLAETAELRSPRTHPHMLRHTFVTTMLDAGVSLRDVQIAARAGRHASWVAGSHSRDGPNRAGILMRCAGLRKTSSKPPPYRRRNVSAWTKNRRSTSGSTSS
ncbi:tyrosine-type recombinase/integrase [Actinoplanes xinjiangensis]|uniref:tyrosine-type recombinase/integrase n=1 Tax=Actinoplanes xinjiangensis TaxID=512350 RepID=UPI00343EBA7F